MSRVDRFSRGIQSVDVSFDRGVRDGLFEIFSQSIERLGILKRATETILTVSLSVFGFRSSSGIPSYPRRERKFLTGGKFDRRVIIGPREKFKVRAAFEFGHSRRRPDS